MCVSMIYVMRWFCIYGVKCKYIRNAHLKSCCCTYLYIYIYIRYRSLYLKRNYVKRPGCLLFVTEETAMKSSALL